MSSTFWIVLSSTLALSAPLMLSSMGGLTSERSGVMNIALEGFMLTAACVAALVGGSTGNAFLGLGAGLASAVLMSLLHGLLTQVYHIDHIVSGMALNALAFGGTNFLDKRFTDVERVGAIPGFSMTAYLVAAFAFPVFIWLYLRGTRGGLRLLAVGNDPEKARQTGIEPIKVRIWSLLWTGIFCGVAGVMIVTNAGRFTDGMTAGKGFIALAALIIGGWRPLPAAAACLVFGAFEALQLQLQGTHFLGGDIPSEAWNALPYTVTIIALAGLLGRNRAPAGLGKD